jgi:hypothetical protein
MKRINPLLTANNPAPIPGCHAPVKVVAHSAVVIYTSPISTQIPPGVMTTEVLDIRPGISHPPKLTKPSTTKIS